MTGSDPGGPLDLLGFAGRLHVLVVHVPIGGLMLLAALELLRGRRPEWRGPIALLAQLSALATVLALATGWIHADATRTRGSLLEAHRAAAIATGALALSAAVLAARGAAALRRALVLLAAIGVGVTGHLGGTLVHGEDHLRLRAPVARPHPDGSAHAPRAEEERTSAFPATVFQTYCQACHGPTLQKGGLRLDGEAEFLAAAQAASPPRDPAAWALLIRERVDLPLDDEDHMPPPRKPQPGSAERAAIIAWAEAFARRR
jgi:mono/diheme cytochrome c family protein